MRIKYLFICLAMAFVSCASADERKGYNLKGEVKSSLIQLYDAAEINGEWVKGKMLLLGHNRITFDEKGVYQGLEKYDSDMDFTEKFVPIRENGKLVEERNYARYGILYTYTEYTYITKNKVTFETFDADDRFLNAGEIIRKNGKIISQSVASMSFGFKGKAQISLYEYDKNDYLILIKETNDKGEIKTYLRYENLEFDAKGNWTKRLVFTEEKEPEHIEIREIEYF